MSLLHPEQHRQCKRCGKDWYAEKYGKDRTGAVQAVSLDLMMGAGAAMGARHVRGREKHDRWALCPNCGSKKVRTIR